jgi:dienelactone hydrolase
MIRSAFVFLASLTAAIAADTFPPLKGGLAPRTHATLWADYDPQAEPLDIEILTEWEEDGVVMRVVRYRVGVFKGKTAKVAGIYGFMKGMKGVPGLVQVHGGGQYADYKAVLTNAKRGYATISISWAGRISAPNYSVSPPIVQKFWDGKTDDPQYKVTTDWGAVDGYHAPSRFKGTSFNDLKPNEWTLDAIESPRNSPWFLATLAARRALTFLERQPEVDAGRLGIYGHSMGGKITVATAGSDKRVKAAAPSCGGVSHRSDEADLYFTTIGDAAALPNVTCPIVFLSPANDFHGRINDLPRSTKEIKSKEWRVTCAPHHNHQDTAEYEVATQLWFDQHLRNNFSWPKTPLTEVQLKTADGIPRIAITPDDTRPIARVEVYYTQQGVDSNDRTLNENRIHQFWHYAQTTPNQAKGKFEASLPIAFTDKPLWVYANVTYKLPKPVSGAGYYYRVYETDTFTVSSLIEMHAPDALQRAEVQATLKPSTVIEGFSGDWRKHWFSYRSESWRLSTNKPYHPLWQAPANASLALEVQSAKANTLIIRLDKHAAEIKLDGGPGWQKLILSRSDFKDADFQPLASWTGLKQLELSEQAHLRGKGKPRKVGGQWQGNAPTFRNLHWQ